jgi:general stress protein 26
VGEAEILTDQETKSRFWQDWFITHFPGGETDPNYCIIKITTKRVSLWVDNEGAESPIENV